MLNLANWQTIEVQERPIKDNTGSVALVMYSPPRSFSEVFKWLYKKSMICVVPDLTANFLPSLDNMRFYI